MPTNFELERLKPKLDIFKIHENRVHELTDSLTIRTLAGGWDLARSRVFSQTDSNVSPRAQCRKSSIFELGASRFRPGAFNPKICTLSHASGIQSLGP